VDIDELPLVGGHPALDLVNTKERGIPVPNREVHDFLIDARALAVWAGRAGLIEDTEVESVDRALAHRPRFAAAALEAVREVREALHVAVLAATGLEAVEKAARDGALEHLHARWLAALGRARLVIEAASEPPVRLHVGTVPASLLVDRAANAALEILRSDDLARVRRCPIESGGCGWLFLDRTRNRSRRWCRMADCGTQVKARRLTERRRTARASQFVAADDHQPDEQRQQLDAAPSPSTGPASNTTRRNRR
jgi:predicted RNA-binding Zn ribbon-like protein